MQTLKQELDALVKQSFPGNRLNIRDQEITYMHYGWDGFGGKSLQETGNKYKLTRERARQIASRFSSFMQPQAPQFLQSLGAISESLQLLAPASADRVEGLLSAHIGTDFKIEGALKAMELFTGQCSDIKVYQENGQRYVIHEGGEKVPSRVLAMAQKVCTHLGMIHVEEMIELLPDLQKDKALDYIRDILSSRDDHVWLDSERNWVWLRDSPRNRFITCLHKMLSVYSSCTVEGAIHGANRYFRKGKGKTRQLEAPAEVVASFINHWGEASCSVNGFIRKTPQFDSQAALMELEEAIVREIWATPEKVIREKALENALVPVIDGETHPKKYNFSIALNYSPLVRKGNLRGQYVANGSI